MIEQNSNAKLHEEYIRTIVRDEIEKYTQREAKKFADEYVKLSKVLNNGSGKLH